MLRFAEHFFYKKWQTNSAFFDMYKTHFYKPLLISINLLRLLLGY